MALEHNFGETTHTSVKVH